MLERAKQARADFFKTIATGVTATAMKTAEERLDSTQGKPSVGETLSLGRASGAHWSILGRGCSVGLGRLCLLMIECKLVPSYRHRERGAQFSLMITF